MTPNPPLGQEIVEIRPQPTQAMALASEADILIFGGAAGGGKSWALLIEALRHTGNGAFGAVIFRRTSPQITNEGGLWDESMRIYPHFGAQPKLNDHTWTFPSGSAVGFGHLQHDKNVHDWQGAAIAMLGFDELPHFSEYQFFYMLSRNRSTCGIKPYVRATCNPDPDSWLRKFIAWWIDEKTGYAIPERAGVIRYMVRMNGMVDWADTPEELEAKYPEHAEAVGAGNFAKSVTFIPSSIYDNQVLLKANPQYLANLMALPQVEREQLLGGNWNARLEAGKFFNRSWFEIVEALPARDPKEKTPIDCRYWDFAATKKDLVKKPGHDPDFSAGTLIRYYPSRDQFYIMDSVAVQADPAETDRLFEQTHKLDKARAKRDRTRLLTRWEIEGGASGKRESYRMTTRLAGSDSKGVRDTRDKITRARALAIQAEAGNVKILNRDFAERLLAHLHGQPDLPHDDEMDSSAGAFNGCVSAAGSRNVSY